MSLILLDWSVDLASTPRRDCGWEGDVPGGECMSLQEEHNPRRQKAKSGEGSGRSSPREQSRVQPVGPRSHQSQTQDPQGCGTGALGLG